VKKLKSKFFEYTDRVQINGEEFLINTDFAVWIEIEQLLMNQKKDNCERMVGILSLAFPCLPPDPVGAMEQVMCFYAGGRMPDSRADASEMRNVAFDLKKDFEYIYAAFLSEYGIDLQKTQMHWWQFRKLLFCLGDDCKFSKIVSFRCMDTSKIKNREVKSFYEKMKRKYRLPDMRTAEEKETEVALKLETLF